MVPPVARQFQEKILTWDTYWQRSCVTMITDGVRMNAGGIYSEEELK